MSRVNLVIVPRWLDRVATELKISDRDLLDLDKLRGILSNRDVLLYQLAQSKRQEIIERVCNFDAMKRVSFAEFGCPLMQPSFDTSVEYRDCELDTFIYGANATKDSEGPNQRFDFIVEWGDQDTLLLKVAPFYGSNLPGVVEGVARKLHGVLGFADWVRTSVFKQYVRDLQINPIV